MSVEWNIINEQMLLCTVLRINPVEQNWRRHCLNHTVWSQPKKVIDRVMLLHSEGNFKENPKSNSVLELLLFLIKKKKEKNYLRFICSKAFWFLLSLWWFSELILMAIQLEIKLSSRSPPVPSQVNTLGEVVYRLNQDKCSTE